MYGWINVTFQGGLLPKIEENNLSFFSALQYKIHHRIKCLVTHVQLYMFFGHTLVFWQVCAISPSWIKMDCTSLIFQLFYETSYSLYYCMISLRPSNLIDNQSPFVICQLFLIYFLTLLLDCASPVCQYQCKIILSIETCLISSNNQAQQKVYYPSSSHVYVSS